MKLAYLYTPSELTPWKENVSMNALQFLKAYTPIHIETEILEFTGFDDSLIEQLKQYDLIFNLSYGYHEAGQVEVAAWLEHHGIVHTASSVESLSKAQDKSLLPDICWRLGFHTPPIYTSVHDLDDDRLYISKPRKGSCHRNIAVENGFWMKNNTNAIGDDLIIQPYIVGREFSVAVIPDESGIGYVALPPMEIVSESNATIFIAGQSFGKTFRHLEPVLSAFDRSQLMFQARKLHKYIGLKGMSRTDFRMSDDGTIYTLDVNAMPNMDPEKSLMPTLCIHHGVGIRELITRLIANTIQFSEYVDPISINNKELLIS